MAHWTNRLSNTQNSTGNNNAAQTSAQGVDSAENAFIVTHQKQVEPLLHAGQMTQDEYRAYMSNVCAQARSLRGNSDHA